MLRVFTKLNILSNMTFHLVEISENLREVQRDNIIKTLKDKNIYISIDRESSDLYEDKLNLRFKWSDDIQKVKHEEFLKVEEQTKKAKTNFLFFRRAVKNENPYFIMAHEFFDAIPVYQFIYDKQRGWLERQVVIDSRQEDQLEITESSKPTMNVKRLLQPEKTFSTPEIRDSLQTGDMIEISPHSMNIMTDISELIAITKGAGLIIDYGENQALSNSIRAIKGHKYLSENEMIRIPGKADISAYVNFKALGFAAENVKGCIASKAIPQGAFLEAMGIFVRKEALLKANVLNPEYVKMKKRIEEDYLRLVHPDQMGEIYKVMFIGNEDKGKPYPFENVDPNKLDEYT